MILYRGERGFVLRFVVRDESGAPIDLTGLVAFLDLEKPSGSNITWNLFVSDPVRGVLEYELQDNDLDEIGRWRAQVRMEEPGTQQSFSSEFGFWVLEPVKNQ